MGSIETGVDRLVNFITEFKKISIQDAAKKLGVGTVVVQEWADFLDEEKVISIEYKFSKTILMERELSKKYLQQKTVAFDSNKDAFIRKVATSMKTLDTETIGLEKIKKEFDKLKREIGEEISSVKKEVEELERYEGLKKNLDTDIKKQQDEFKQMINSAHIDIKNSEKSYNSLLEKIGLEKRDLAIKESKLSKLDEKEHHILEQEEELKQRIKAIYELAETVKEKVEDEGKEIQIEEGHIKKLEKIAQELENEVDSKKKKLIPLVDLAKEHEKKIIKIQEDIYSKVLKKSSQIKAQVHESETVISKFNKFFDRKSDVEELLSKIEKDREDLKKELEILTKKAIAFEVLKKSSNIKDHIKTLQKEFSKIDKKRNIFKKEIDKLVSLVKG